LIETCARFGLFDIPWAMSLYKWELDAVIKGVLMSQIDERERLAVLAANIGYFNNSKKPKFNKVFDRDKEEKKLEEIYKPSESQAHKRKQLELYKNVMSAFGGERSENGDI
jgi:hypothetical protein